MRRAVKIYDWLGGRIYNLFPNSLASSIYAIPDITIEHYIDQNKLVCSGNITGEFSIHKVI